METVGPRLHMTCIHLQNIFIWNEQQQQQNGWQWIILNTTIICSAAISALETMLTYTKWLSNIQLWQNFTEDSCFISMMNLALYGLVLLLTINSSHVLVF